MMVRRHILTFLVCVVSLMSCSDEGGKVIPRSKLAEIYAEMFITDQWVAGTSSVRRQADTSLVYEPILNKYGYTAADYRKSVEAYMDDPERFSRILRASVGILDEKIKELKIRKEELDHIKAMEKLLKQLKYEADFKAEEFFPYLFDEPYVHYYDSLTVEPDSALMIYRLKNVEKTDTLFDGLRLIVRDTLKVADTLQTPDIEPVETTVSHKEIIKPKRMKNSALKSLRKGVIEKVSE